MPHDNATDELAHFSTQDVGISDDHFDAQQPEEFILPIPHPDSASLHDDSVPKKAHRRKRRARYTDHIRKKQLRDAARKYAKRHPEVHRAAKAKYQRNHPEVNRAAVARYQKNHPEVHRATVARYQKRHPEVHRAAVARYQKNHPEVHRAAVARYQKNHPEVHRAAVARYQKNHPEVHRITVARYQENHPKVNGATDFQQELSNLSARLVEKQGLPWKVKALSSMTYALDEEGNVVVLCT